MVLRPCHARTRDQVRPPSHIVGARAHQDLCQPIIGTRTWSNPVTIINIPSPLKIWLSIIQTEIIKSMITLYFVAQEQ
jgi:hypothetical protein